MLVSSSKKHGYQQWAITISHYCNTLSRKPGALRSSVALRQAEPFLQELYLGYYLGKERSFIELVQYCEAIGIEKVEEKVKQLKVLAPYSVTTEAIKTLCERSVVNFSTNKDENSEIFQCANKQLRRYGLLLQTDTGADNFE